MSSELFGLVVRDHLILADEGAFHSMAQAGDLAELRGVWSDDGMKRLLRAAFQEVDVEREALGSARRRAPAKPKYRDPETGETWAGRGSMANWLKRHLEAGRSLEEFRVADEESR